MFTKKILIDLDGVLNEYGKEKFNENHIPEIKIGAYEFLETLSQNAELYLFTSRNLMLATKWLINNNLDKFFKDVTNIKLPSYLYIDENGNRTGKKYDVLHVIGGGANADYLNQITADYTGKIERQVEKERRQRDPILFGTFQNKSTRTVIDRFYFLGDWEDEYCDLTLDKMVNEIKSEKKYNVLRTINTPKDIKELKEQLNQLTPYNDTFRINNSKSKEKGFFEKITTFLRMRKNEK